MTKFTTTFSSPVVAASLLLVQRRGIPGSRILAEATMLNRSATVMERDSWILPTLVTVVVLLVVTTIVLLWYLRYLRQAERQLRASEKRFRALFEQASDYAMILDPNTADGIPIIVDASKSAYEMHRYTHAEFIGRPVADVDDEEGRKLVVERTKHIMSGKPLLVENTHVRKDGTAFPVSVHANRIDVEGEPPLILTTEYDISERKQAEQKLKESEEKFRSIFEQSPIAIQIYDKEGKLVDVNQQTLDLLGIEDKRHILEYEKWTSSNYTPETIEAIQSGQPIYLSASLDFERVKRDGLFPTDKSGVVYLELYGIPLMIEEEITGYLVQLVDVTQRKEMESRLSQVRKMESIGRLAGGIAHDFNNILVPIIGYVDLAMMSLTPDDKLYIRLKRIRKAADRAAGLTHQILAFSRKQILQTQVLDLNTIVEDYKNMLQRLIGENIDLQIFLDPALSQIEADAGQIGQVLMNLTINSRDAMPAGGNLTIETANVYLDEASVRRYAGAQAVGHHVMLAVSDTGFGMDAKTQEQIFEPFFTTKEREKGTGLGLSTVFGIIKQHGGNIWVSSEPNKGTIFKIYLPKVDSSATTPEATRPQVSSACGTETILLVEDEEMVRQLVCEALTAYGYEVLQAQSPQDALQLAIERKGAIHLLVTDVIMPALNGKELYRKIATIDTNIKVLYMSGYSDDVIIHHGVLDESVNFIQKPFTVRGLTEKVRQVLSEGDL